MGVAFYNGFARTSTFDVLTSRDGDTWDKGLESVVTSGTTDDLESYDLADRPPRILSSAEPGITQRRPRGRFGTLVDCPLRQMKDVSSLVTPRARCTEQA